MNFWHNQLLQKYPNYHHWHQHPRHPFWHWVAFSFFITFIFTYLYTDILDYRNQEISQVNLYIPQAQAAGTTYYVSTSGSDSNSCSAAQNTNTPKRTITNAMGCLAAGDTLYVRGGTYGENISSTPSGTSWTNPVTITSYPGETATFRSIGFTSAEQYVIFDGLIVDAQNAVEQPIYLDPDYSHHIRFTNIEAKNGTFGGVVTGNCDSSSNCHTYYEFIGMKVHNNGDTARYDHGFYIQSSDNLVEKSEIYNNAAYGVHIYTGGQAADNNIVRNNKIYSNGVLTQGTSMTAFGLLLINGSNNQAYNNIIYNNTSGIQIGGTNAKVYNNTVYANTSNGYAVIEASGSNGAIVKNNILWQNPSNLINGGSNLVQSNNLTTDPKFINAAANDFHLQSTSPAINTGVNLSPVVTTDFDDISRPQGSAYDIGAYEYVGTATTGRTFFISPSGSDSNSCAQAQFPSTPFVTISKLINGNPCALAGGDTIEIRASTAGGSALFTDRFDCNVNSTQCIPGGTSWTSPLTIKARAGDFITIKPAGNGRVFSFDNANQHHIIVDNLIIDGDNDTQNDAFVMEDNTHHVRLINSTVRNAYHVGIGCFRPSGTTVAEGLEVLNSIVHNNGTDIQLDHGIYIGCPNSLVANSSIYNSSSLGVHVYSGYGASYVPGQTIRNNRIYNNGGRGLLLSGLGSQAYNNLIYNNGTNPVPYGAGVWLEYSGGCDNCQLYNNTIYGNRQEGMVVGVETAGADIKNNIIYNNLGGQITNNGASTILGTNFCGSAGTGCALSGNPSFVNAGTNDFHLQSTSPAINAGATLSEVTIDFDGISRPQGSAYDIGAYEYGGVVSTTPTPTPTPISTASPTLTLPPGCFIGSASWQSQPITSQTGKFRAEFDATPAATNIDGVIGLSQTAASAYTSLAAIVRFNNQGLIDARNGANYAATTSLPYTAGINYHFRLEIDVPSHTYSIYVTPQGGSEITLGINYAFRTEQLSVTSLNYWNIISNAGNTTICNFSISNVITPPSFSSCDLNKDTKTDVLDFQSLINVILGFTPNLGGSDINKDGQVNILDTQVLANVILGKTTCP